MPLTVSRCTSRFGQSKDQVAAVEIATFRRMDKAFFSVLVQVRCVRIVTVPTLHSVPSRAYAIAASGYSASRCVSSLRTEEGQIIELRLRVHLCHGALPSVSLVSVTVLTLYTSSTIWIFFSLSI